MKDPKSFINKKLSPQYKVVCVILLITLVIVYLAGLPIDIMVVDAAVYAHIAMEMFLEGDYLTITLEGKDWLDKPHLQFWVIALGYELLGISTVVYKLPALLFVLGAAWYTYLFARRFYSEKHGWFAAIILLASFHTVLSNSDVRAEPYLTFFTIFSVYQLVIYIEDRVRFRLMLACAGMACLMMIKGPYTIIPVVSAVLLALAFTKNWKQVIHIQWLLIGALALIFTAPVIYAYYVQFDLHPEKIVFGETGVSGVRFFFWDSQWGRFDSSGPISKTAGDPLFFMHTILWAFAPWAVIALAGIVRRIKELIKGRKSEYYSLFGFLPLFLIFSLSDFQLPHYLNPLFPFLAVISADEILRFVTRFRAMKILLALQWTQVGLLYLLVVYLQYFFFRDFFPWYIHVILIGVVFSFILLRKFDISERVLFYGTIALVFVGFYINSTFYPSLLKYQSETMVARYISENAINPEEVAGFGTNCLPMGFHLKRTVPVLYDVGSERLRDYLIYTDEDGKAELEGRYVIEIVQQFDHYRVTKLHHTFVDIDKRKDVQKKAFLIRIAD